MKRNSSMCKILRVVVIIFSIFHHHKAEAQNWTTISASNITDLNQQVLAAGKLCFLATDQYDTPISFKVGGGGQVLARPYCSNVSSGVVTSFTVPNPANTTPAGILYRVTVTDTSTGITPLKYKAVAFLGTTFNFDNYLPPGFIGGVSGVAGPLTITGTELVTGVTQIGSSDTGFSRDSAGVIDAGNGTAGDKSAIIQAGGLLIGTNGTQFTVLQKVNASPTLTAITGGTCSAFSVTMTGAGAGNVCWASPSTALDTGYFYGGCRGVSSNTVAINVCAFATGTPTSVNWNVWRIQ